MKNGSRVRSCSDEIEANPYAARLKRQVTLRVSDDVIDYFEGLAKESGIPYEVLIDLYLRDCVSSQRKLEVHWAP